MFDTWPLLSLVIWTPIVGGMLVLATGGDKNANEARVLALIVSRPLGPIIQKNLTTSGTPGALKVLSITKQRLNGISAHRVKTQD